MKNNIIRELTFENVIEPKWLTTDQAAKHLCISTQGLLNMCSQGKIIFFKLGRRNRYRLSDLDALMLANPRGDFHGH